MHTTAHCPACTYDLTGLTLPATCPECGGNVDDTTVHRIKAWPSTRDITFHLLWPGLISPLLLVFWLIHRWPGILASTALLLACMFVPVTVGGSISVDCAVPSRRDAAFLKLLITGWGLNFLSWALFTLVGYALNG